MCNLILTSINIFISIVLIFHSSPLGVPLLRKFIGINYYVNEFLEERLFDLVHIFYNLQWHIPHQ